MSDQTRRDWVFTIGQAAVALTVPAGIYGDTAKPATLPPGLYSPSTDDLGHALMSADPYHPIPPECPTDYIRPRTGSFKPLFFTSAEFPAVLRLIQLMLGEVKHDARVSQEVAEWFDLYLASAEPVQEAEMHLDPLYHALAAAFYGSAAMRTGAKAKPAAIGRKGIQWVLHAARTRYAKEFLSLALEQQTAILHSISDETPAQSENSGTRFFTLLKAETIRGFYTSRIGLQELNFKGNAFYSQSPGCNTK